MDRESTNIDFDRIAHRTADATLFDNGDGGFWVPNKLIDEIDEEARTVTVPVWFAEKEGLV